MEGSRRLGQREKEKAMIFMALLVIIISLACTLSEMGSHCAILISLQFGHFISSVFTISIMNVFSLFLFLPTLTNLPCHH